MSSMSDCGPIASMCPTNRPARIELRVYREREWQDLLPAIEESGAERGEVLLARPALRRGDGSSAIAEDEANIRFSEELILRGWRVPETGAAGDETEILTAWRTAERQIYRSLTFSLHLFRGEEPIANLDSPPRAGALQTYSLRPNYLFDDKMSLTLPRRSRRLRVPASASMNQLQRSDSSPAKVSTTASIWAQFASLHSALGCIQTPDIVQSIQDDQTNQPMMPAMKVKTAACSVEDVRKLALPLGTDVAAADGALSETVSWALLYAPEDTLTARAPSPNELLLIDTDEAGESRVDEAAIRWASEHGASAIVCAVEPTPTAIAAANRRKIPLLILPGEIDLRETQRDILALLVDRRGQLARRSTQVFRQLTQISSHNAGPSPLLEGARSPDRQSCRVAG